MWSAIKAVIVALCKMIEQFANSGVNLANASYNATKAVELEAAKLIPTDEQYKAGLDLAIAQRDARISEEKAKLDALKDKFNSNK